MTKGYVDAFLEVIDGVLRDAVTLDHTLHKGCERDKTRLASLVSKHGHSVFTLLLPAIGKVLDQALDSGLLPLIGLPLAGRINTRTTIPRLFQGIWLKVFDISGCLKQEIDPTWVLLLRQLYYAGAKELIECSPSAVFRTTKEFFDVESSLPPAGPIWDSAIDNVDRGMCGSLLDRIPYDRDTGDLFEKPNLPDIALLTLCQRVADRVVASMGSFSPHRYDFRQGPGATSETPRGRGYKYSFPAWSPRLEDLFPFDEFGVPNSSVLAGDQSDRERPSEVEGHSRLVDVPKTAKGPRLIAAEPGSNQWCQQCGLSYFREVLRSDATARVRRDGALRLPINGPWDAIDFRNQDASRALARDSSLSASHATIDLKSASDRLSCWLIQRLFRANLSVLQLLVATRTRYMYNGLDKKYPSHIKLRKFATMGSALTFPVQSISFFILTISALLFERGWDASRWRSVCPEVRVYGDDIIVPIEGHKRLVGLLQLVGLAVNPQKTFFGRNFRESCGMDAFRGVDVTPVKVRRLPSKPRFGDVISMIDTSNEAFLKGLWWMASAIESAVPQNLRKEIPVVRASSGLWGVKSFCGGMTTARKRWNHDLQRDEVLLLQPKAVVRKTQRHESDANLLQFFTEDPVGSLLSEWSSGMVGTAEAGLGRRRVGVEELI